MIYLKIHLAFSAHQNPRCVSNKSRFVLLFHIHVAAIILSSKELKSYLFDVFFNFLDFEHNYIKRGIIANEMNLIDDQI